MFKNKTRFTAMMIALLTLLTVFSFSLSGCDAETGSDATDTSSEIPDVSVTEEPVDDVPNVLEITPENYSIVRSVVAENGIVKSVANLNKKIKIMTGMAFSVLDDWVSGPQDNVSVDTPEILFGKTNRRETAEVLARLPENSYAVQVVGNKLVIVGTDDSMTALAAFAFDEKILKNPENCASGKFTVSADDGFVVEFGKKMTLPDMLKAGYQISAVPYPVMHATPVGEYKVAQGAASDGTYAYFILRTSENGNAVIAKYKLDDGTFVAKSEPIYVFHGNDMTYDKAQNRLVVSHGSSEGTILTTVDADTLQVIKKTVNISVGSGAISYSVATGKFAISQGGKSLHIADSDLKVISSYDKMTEEGYTAQGMGSDEDFVYFPMSSSKDNVLQVYSWDAKYYGAIHIPLTYESESMFWVNDTYYVNFYGSGNGAYLFRIEFSVIYK